MSGPKCSEWSVVENRRRLELARLEALAEASGLIDQVSRLQKDLQRRRLDLGFANSIRKMYAAFDLRRDAAMSEIQRQTADLRREMEALQAEAHAVTTMASLSALAARVGALAQAEAAGETLRLQQSAASRAETATRIAGRAPVGLTDAERADIVALAEAFVAAETPGMERGREEELRRRVQSLHKADETRRLHLALAADLRAELLGLEGPDVALARQAIVAVEAGQRALDPGFEQQVRKTAAQAREASDRAYALEVLRDEFSALGYEVGETFDSAFLNGGKLAISRADRTDYAVDISIDPRDRTLSTCLIRTSASPLSAAEQRLRDREAEEGWCGDYARILAAASRRKVQARVTLRIAPGAEPVAVRADVATRTTGRRSAQQMRERSD